MPYAKTDFGSTAFEPQNLYDMQKLDDRGRNLYNQLSNEQYNFNEEDLKKYYQRSKELADLMEFMRSIKSRNESAGMRAVDQGYNSLMSPLMGR